MLAQELEAPIRRFFHADWLRRKDNMEGRILAAFLSVSGLGLTFGLLLAVASKLLAVQKDELIERLENALPGLNCGACGYAGCVSYAEAIARDKETEINLCAPGGESVMNKLAEITGREVSLSKEKMVTQVHCRGGRKTSLYHFDYKGVKDCNALFALYGGDKVCPYGCLALGSCIQVCPVDAIGYDDEGLVWVDKIECIGCGKCIEVCPTGVMQFIPYKADYIVACNSIDKGGKVKKYCSVGCIGCKICEKKSPQGGYKVENFLARIDYSQKGERENGAIKCPSKCIIKNLKQ
jgi:electron transport complex protein RnfB